MTDAAIPAKKPRSRIFLFFRNLGIFFVCGVVVLFASAAFLPTGVDPKGGDAIYDLAHAIPGLSGFLAAITSFFSVPKSVKGVFLLGIGASLALVLPFFFPR